MCVAVPALFHWCSSFPILDFAMQSRFTESVVCCDQLGIYGCALTIAFCDQSSSGDRLVVRQAERFCDRWAVA